MVKILDKIRKNKWVLDGLKKVILLKLYRSLSASTVSKFQEKQPKTEKQKALELYEKYFEEDIKQLEALTSIDFSICKSKYL